MSLLLSDQTKMSQGRLPVVGARLVRGAGDSGAAGAHEAEDFIAFDLASPQDLGNAACPVRLRLEDLSVVRAGGGVDREDVLALARVSGPLFGEGPYERVIDWLAALSVARQAVLIQEVLNGTKPPAPALFPVEKRVVENVRTRKSFRIYSAAFDLGDAEGSAYLRMLPELPLLRKFRSSDAFDYAFATKEVAGGKATLLLFLLSFDEEIDVSDFAAAVRYFAGDEAVLCVADAFGLASTEVESDFDLLSSADNLLVSADPVSAGDFPHVQRLVHALASLHVRGARVDLFSADEDGDFMTFDSYLCCLWYGFAKKLSDVRIGYCAQCGKGFSLTGHRGIERRFCSERCKTKAKNDRASAQRDEVRERFYAGESVEQLSREVFPKDSTTRAVERVVAHLRGWKKLQHDIDAALVLKGSREKLLARCLAEGVMSESEIAMRMRYLAETPRVVREVYRREGA